MRLAGTDLNLDLELSLSPVIQELVRTQVCLPNLKLLVHRIAVVTLPEVDDVDGNEAFKLTLTDGDKTIQGMKPLSLFMCFSVLIYYHQRSLSAESTKHSTTPIFVRVPMSS